MKCPRCKFVSNETADACPKCKFDLARYRSLLGLGGVDSRGGRPGHEHVGESSHVAATVAATVADTATKATKGGFHSEDDWFSRFFGSSKGGSESSESFPSAPVHPVPVPSAPVPHVPVADQTIQQVPTAEEESRGGESRDDWSITDKLGELFKEEKDASSKLLSKDNSLYDSVSTEQFFDSLLDASADKLGVDLADLAGLGKIGRCEILTEMEESSEELNNLEAELERELELLSSEGKNLGAESVEADEQGFVATSQLEELERELERDLQDMVAGGEEQKDAQSAWELEQETPSGINFDEPLLSKDMEAELDSELKSLESEGFKFLSVESADGEGKSCVVEEYAELGDILAELETLEQEQIGQEQIGQEQIGQEQSGLGFLDGLSENELEDDGLSSAELQIIADRIASAGKARLLDAMRVFEEEIQEGQGSLEQDGGAPDCDTYSSLEDVLAELEQESVSELEAEDLTEEKSANDCAVSGKVEVCDLLSETSSKKGSTPPAMHPDISSDTPPNTSPNTPCITQLPSQSSVVDVVISSLSVMNTVAMDAATDVEGSTSVDNLWEELSVELQSPHLRNEHRDFAFTDLAITHLGSVSQNPNADLHFSELEDEILMGGRAGKARVREQFLRAREAGTSYSAELQDESINSAMQEALREVEQQECVVDHEPTIGRKIGREIDRKISREISRDRSREQRSGRLSRSGDSRSVNRVGSSDEGLLEERSSYATADMTEHSSPRPLRILCAQTMDVLLFVGLSLVLEVVFSVPKEMREAILKVSFQSLWICDLLPHAADALVRFAFLYMVCNTWLVFSSGQTLGQRVFGLVTCDSSGDVPGFSQAFVSSAAIAPYLLTCGLGALPIFGAQRQMLGRYLSHTEIVDH